MEFGPPARPEPAGDPAGTAARGQLILVVSLAIAVTFVGLALLLNTAIYTENLASRADHGATVPVELTDASVDAVDESLRYVNRHDNVSKAAVNENFTAAVDGWESMAARQSSLDGILLSLRVTSRTNGTRIQQTDPTRSYTAGGSQAGDGNWSLVTDTSGVRSVRLVPNRDDLHEVTLSGDSIENAGTVLDRAFNVAVTNATQRWRLYVVRNETEVLVFSEYPDGDLSGASEIDDFCTVTATAPVVDVTNGSLAGEPCDELAFPSEMEGPLTVSYANADDRSGSSRSGGEYSLVVAGSVDSSPYDAPPGSPFATPVLYGVEAQTEVRTPDVDYSETETVVPGDQLR